MNKVYSVSEFIDAANELLAFEVLIEGEVSGFNISQNKWVFFDLKDKDEAKIGCFMGAWALKEALEDGMSIRVRGTPGIHKKYGKFSITVKEIQLMGDGALRRSFELLKAKLQSEGLFASERKRPLPRFPSKIGLIASRESAAYTDFMRILNNRWGGIEVNLLHVQVQGKEAALQIVGAIQYLNREMPDLEALVITRGGGSMDDLQAFNSEEVVRAIFASKIPTLVGIGHERDETLAEYAADVRASTPSNAAERLTPDRGEILSSLEHYTHLLEQHLAIKIKDYSVKIESAGNIFENFVGVRQNEVDGLYHNLEEGMGRLILDKKNRLDFLSRTIKNLNPENLLARGFSIVFKSGKVVKDAGLLPAGEIVDIKLSKGRVRSKII